MEYDKKILSTNINFLLKEKGRKAIDLDDAIHKSAGYTAKIFGDDNPTNPSIDTVVYAADFLDVSVTTLLFSKMDTMSASELYVSSFLARLEAHTASSKLTWLQESKASLESLAFDEQFECVDHPLMAGRVETEYTAKDPSGKVYNTIIYYRSLFEQGHCYVLSGNCFHARLNNNSTVYLSKVRIAGEAGTEDEFELYLLPDHKSALPICRSLLDGNRLFEKDLRELYSLVAETMSHVRLNANARSILDSFMSEKSLDIDKDVIPF